MMDQKRVSLARPIWVGYIRFTLLPGWLLEAKLEERKTRKGPALSFLSFLRESARGSSAAVMPSGVKSKISAVVRTAPRRTRAPLFSFPPTRSVFFPHIIRSCSDYYKRRSTCFASLFPSCHKVKSTSLNCCKKKMIYERSKRESCVTDVRHRAQNTRAGRLGKRAPHLHWPARSSRGQFQLRDLLMILKVDP